MNRDAPAPEDGVDPAYRCRDHARHHIQLLQELVVGAREPLAIVSGAPGIDGDQQHRLRPEAEVVREIRRCLTNSAAALSKIKDSAIWAAMSALPNRRRDRLSERRRSGAGSLLADEVQAIQAGAMPNSRPVTNATAVVNSSTWRSTRSGISAIDPPPDITPRPDITSRASARAAKYASPTPRSAPSPRAGGIL